MRLSINSVYKFGCLLASAVCLGGCAGLGTFAHEGLFALSTTKQKQRITLLQKKLEGAEKHLQNTQDEVEHLRAEIHQAQLILIEKQLDTYELQIQQSPEILARMSSEEKRLLFAKEREVLQQMMEEGPSSDAFDAQLVLDRILRVITVLRG
jgi:hypothetical protein